MRILVDTSVWIEYLRGKPLYLTNMEYLFSRQLVVALEVVFAELLQGARNKRERLHINRYWQNLPNIDEKEMILQAGEFAGQNKFFAKGVGLIDATIILMARKHNMLVWSLDKRLIAQLEEAEKFQFLPF